MVNVEPNFQGEQGLLKNLIFQSTCNLQKNEPPLKQPKDNLVVNVTFGDKTSTAKADDDLDNFDKF